MGKLFFQLALHQFWEKMLGNFRNGILGGRKFPAAEIISPGFRELRESAQSDIKRVLKTTF